MRIDTNSAWRPARAEDSAVGRSQSGQAHHQATPARSDVAMARQTALSALNNERFRAALDMLSSPTSSDAVMQMRGDGGSSADHRSVLASYADS
jgi:hypothetical protein